MWTQTALCHSINHILVVVFAFCNLYYKARQIVNYLLQFHDHTTIGEEKVLKKVVNFCVPTCPIFAGLVTIVRVDSTMHTPQNNMD